MEKQRSADLPARWKRPLSARFDEALVLASTLHRTQARVGVEVWDRFSVPCERTVWYYETLLSVFERELSPVLHDTLNDCVRRMKELN
jgi:hypothetical protein